MKETVDDAIRILEDTQDIQGKCFVFSDLIGPYLIGFRDPIVDSPRVFNDEERTDWRFFPKQNINLIGINLLPNTYEFPEGYVRPAPNTHDYNVGYIPRDLLERILKLGEEGLVDFHLRDRVTISCSYPIQVAEKNGGLIKRTIPLTTFREGCCFLSDRVQDDLMWDKVGRVFFRQFIRKWHAIESKSNEDPNPQELEDLLRGSGEMFYRLHNWVTYQVLGFAYFQVYKPERLPDAIGIARWLFRFGDLPPQTLEQLIKISIEALNQGDEGYLDNLFSRVAGKFKKYSGTLWKIGFALRDLDWANRRAREIVLEDIEKSDEPDKAELVNLARQVLAEDKSVQLETLNTLGEIFRSKVAAGLFDL